VQEAGGPVMTATIRPFGQAAESYRQAGWGVFPLPKGQKFPPPSGWTGGDGTDADADQIRLWVAQNGRGNIGVRMPPNIIGIDVDNYNDKTGGADLAVLEAKLGALPPTFISTSREDGVSGIRFFTVPAGLMWQGKLGNSIDIIQRKHRYAVVEPSIHPSGNPYRWLDSEWKPLGRVPTLAELPEMPMAWVQFLTGGEVDEGPAPRKPTVTPLDTNQTLTSGTPCKAMVKAFDEYTLRKTHMARHDAMIATVLALVRLGEQGHQGAGQAVEQLRAQFGADVAGERSQGAEESEFQRALTGAAARVLGSPTVEAERGCCGPSTATTNAVSVLPEEFWVARPVLAHIRQAAHSHGRAGDLVLYATLARMSAMVSHMLRFDTGLGEGSLNLFVAAIGKSGRGKSAACRVARNLVPVPLYLREPGLFRDGLGIGSGEGVAESYMGWEVRETDEILRSGPRRGEPRTERVRAQVRHNMFIYVDEGETLTKQGGRNGATIMPVIRSAFGGELLGQANAREETTRHLPAGSYALGMVIGFQASTAQPLLADATAGTPQRFLWCSATDPSVPEKPPEHPGNLEVGLETAMGGPRTGTITFMTEIKQELWAENLKKVRGEVEDDDELDSHVPLMLAKVAALLTILDGRQVVTSEDWNLAKTIWATSRAVRAELVDYGQELEEKKAEARADVHVNKEIRAHVAKGQVAARVTRIAANIFAKVSDSGVLTQGEARRVLAYRDRRLFSEALDHAAGLGWLITDGDKIAVGISKPGQS
jgi:hypothetical protein